MSHPEPKPGLVVRYWYSWGKDSEGQPLAAKKDRPCVILRTQKTGPDTWVTLAPITHTQPQAPGVGLRIPPKTAARMGLDDRPQWLITNNLNECRWPSEDLEPVRGTNPPKWTHGVIPEALGREALQRVQRQHQLKQLTRVNRERTPEKSAGRDDQSR